jgi:murein DD-endopeptidase MepM/ murein hydrolase activator NlpD
MSRFVLALALLGATGWVVAWPVGTEGDASVAPVVYMDPEISWDPESPAEGRLFRVRVTASQHSPLLGVHGEVGGETLHFDSRDGRVFESLAAIPIGTAGALTASIRVVYAAGGEERLEASIPVRGGDYPLERLTVAPRFGSPLNAEDQARLDRDRVLAAAASASAHRTPRLRDEVAVLPRDSRVTSEFGGGRVFNGQVSSRHMGLDLQGATGDTVRAAARGLVELVEPFLLAGNVVYLNHGAGLLSGYFHLSRQLVAPGDTVHAGDPIGLVGATGRVTGPHLHWVVRYGRTSVDPRSLVEAAAPN